MELTSLKILNFKNYKDLTIQFENACTCIVGDNGSGKTNLLDAIHYLSMAKSAVGGSESGNIRFGEDFFRIEGRFVKNSKEAIVACTYQNGQKKSIIVDKKEVETLKDHIGSFPTIFISPNDNDLVREYADIRRRFFDSALCQVDKSYLNNLVKYQNILRQRNAYLKKATRPGSSIDHSMINTYNDQLLPLAHGISKDRKHFLEELLPQLKTHYEYLSGGKEEPSVSYKSDLEQPDFEKQFKNNLERDYQIGRTEMGIQRDDYIFMMNKEPIKKFGSEGQQKTFVISLKLSQYDYISINKKIKPILLLDDIFDRLDDHRIGYLLSMVSSETFGQIFITDARKDRTSEILNNNGVDADIYEIINGNIQKL